MTQTTLPFAPRPPSRLLTKAQFQNLRDVPPESEWFANIKPQPAKKPNNLMYVHGLGRIGRYRHSDATSAARGRGTACANTRVCVSDARGQ